MSAGSKAMTATFADVRLPSKGVCNTVCPDAIDLHRGHLKRDIACMIKIFTIIHDTLRSISRRLVRPGQRQSRHVACMLVHA